jgi:hypothetical protein
MLEDNFLTDFILNISRYEVTCFISRNEVFTSRISSFDDNSNLINLIAEAVKDVILKAETVLYKHLERGILVTDFIEIKKNNVKINQYSKTIVSKIKEEFELKLGRKVISLLHLSKTDNSHLIQVLSTSKEDMQVISDAINKTEIEILEAKPTIQFLSHRVFLEDKKEQFVIIKFNNEFCEIGKVKNGMLIMYNFNIEWGVKNLLEHLGEKFKLQQEDMLTILTHYTSHSKLERMQRYYDREDFDFHLKEFIEENRNILAMHFEVKKHLVNLKQKIKESFKLNLAVPFYFFYDYKFQDLNLHQVLKQPEENFGLENLGNFLKSSKNNKNPFFGVFSNQVKKIFHLTS